MAKRHPTASTPPAERLQLRRENIEFLMRHEFPGSNAPPPIVTLSAASQASIEAARANREAWEARRNAQDARRAALFKMPDEQLDALAKQARTNERERDRIRRERQTPLAVEPDWQFWTHEDEWELHEAALLLVKLEPRKGLGLHLKKMMRGEYNDGRHVRSELTPAGLSDEAQALFVTMHEIVRRAQVAYRKGKLAIEFNKRINSDERRGTVEPHPFLVWASEKGYELPGGLTALIANATGQRLSTATNEKATRASAEKRRGQHIERDRRIHEAYAAGKQPKQIGADRSIVGDEELSPSRVREILRSPKP